jgi:8-oxo-dGTP diphosphatase
MSEAGEILVFGESLPGRMRVRRPSVYALVKNQHEEFAIVRTRRGLFLPGGGIESGETAAKAVVRETREECGLLVFPKRELGRAVQLVHARGKELTFEKTSAFWWAELVKERVADPEPGNELVWLLAVEARDRMFHESQAWALRQWGDATGGSR